MACGCGAGGAGLVGGGAETLFCGLTGSRAATGGEGAVGFTEVMAGFPAAPP
jgi:hypothetical protein